MDDQFANELLNHPSIYVPAQDAFDLVQGSGLKMTETEFEAHENNKKKRKHKFIAHGSYYYKDIFHLSKQIDDRIMNHLKLFPHAPVCQLSDRVHCIGNIVMGLRKLSSRGDIHSIPDQSFHALVNSNKNKHLDAFYYVLIHDVML